MGRSCTGPVLGHGTLDRGDHGFGEDGFINKTGFRPDDSRMQTDQLGPAGKSRAGKQVTIIHGLNAQHGTDGNVENLNARSRVGVTPITKVFY